MGATSDAASDEAAAGDGPRGLAGEGAERPPGTRRADGRLLPPGPSGWPLLGSLPSFVRDPLGFYERLATEYDGDVLRYRINRDVAYFLAHPDLVERVLVDDHDRFCKGFVNQQTLGEAIDEGLFLAEGEAWATQRKRLQPAFYRESIEGYADAMSEFADRRVAGWADGEVIDVQAEMQALTLEVLTHSLFDIDIGRDGETEIGRAARDVLQRFDSQSLSAWLPYWVPTPINRRFERGLADLHDVIDDLIAERRASEGTGEDLLSILLTATGADEGGMSESQLRDEMVTFLLAGHETTSLALTFALFELARTPEAAERLRAEVDAVLDGPAATLADLPDLEYTGHAVDESLRLYPPAWNIMREPTDPVEIGGYEIRPGEAVAVPPFAVQRDPRWYDDPQEYRPARWEDGLREALPDYAYFPFGGGPRACIGMRFALQEAQLALATAARQVELEPLDDSDLPLAVALTMQPGRTIEARVHRRDGA